MREPQQTAHTGGRESGEEAVQDKMRRALSIEIGEAVIRFTEGGLSGDRVIEALQEHLDQERRLAASRMALERTY